MRTLVTFVVVALALAASIFAPLVPLMTPQSAYSLSSSQLCRFSTIRVLFDVSASVDPSERERLLAAVNRIAEAGRSCLVAPQIVFYTFTDVAWGGLSLGDARVQVEQLARQTPKNSTGWTDPAKAVAGLGRQAGVETVVVFDGMVEPGHDGPPDDVPGYVDALRALSAPESPVFLWGIGQQGDVRFPPYASLWERLQATGLGEMSQVSSSAELALPASFDGTEGPAVVPTPTAAAAAEIQPTTTSEPASPTTNLPATAVAAPSRAAGARVPWLPLAGAVCLVAVVALFFFLRYGWTAAPERTHTPHTDVAFVTSNGLAAVERVRLEEARSRSLGGTATKVSVRGGDLVVARSSGEVVVPRAGTPVQVGEVMVRRVTPFTNPFDGMKKPSRDETAPVHAADDGFYE